MDRTPTYCTNVRRSRGSARRTVAPQGARGVPMKCAAAHRASHAVRGCPWRAVREGGATDLPATAEAA